MSDLLVSLSGLETAAICPGSMALPRVQHVAAVADEGSAGHEYEQVLVERGRVAAEAEAPAIAERWGVADPEAWFGRMRAFEPPIPPGALAEVPLALLENGSVVEVEGGRGRYDVPNGTVIAGTIDVLWSEPRPFRVFAADGAMPRLVETSPAAALWVADLKFGQADFVPPVGRNLQVRVGSLLAARWTGAVRVVPALIFPGRGPGRWDAPLDGDGNAVPLEAEDLARIEADVRRVVARGREARRLVLAGERPELVAGAHCAHCKSRSACPAHVEEVRALVAAPAAPLGPLTHAQATAAAELLTRLGTYQRLLRAALEDFVTTHPGEPLVLRNGKAWGPRETTRRVLRTRPTYEALLTALVGLVGEERAGELADDAFRASKDSLEEALRVARDEAGLGRGLAPALRGLLDGIKQAGGIAERPGVEWGAHYEAAQAAPGKAA